MCSSDLGLAGYFGYDTVRHIEKKLAHTCPPDTLGCPDIFLLHCEEVAVIDNLTGKLHFIVYADPAQAGAFERARARLHELHERLCQPVIPPRLRPAPAQAVHREFDKTPFRCLLSGCGTSSPQADGSERPGPWSPSCPLSLLPGVNGSCGRPR